MMFRPFKVCPQLVDGAWRKIMTPLTHVAEAKDLPL